MVSPNWRVSLMCVYGVTGILEAKYADSLFSLNCGKQSLP